MLSLRKKVPGHPTPETWLICIFSKWPPLKILICTNFLWLVLDPINVLATDINMGFLNKINIISSPCDVPWRSCDVKIRQRVWPVGEFLKKRYMYSYKNFCVYFTYLPRSPLVQIYMKFCMRGHLADVINCAKFYLNQIRGFDSVGRRIFGLPIRKRSRR